ncbi:winged helix-turn-helix domain-containing protein [Salana multivorans]
MLRALGDGEVHRARALCEAAADDLGVSAEGREILIPSGMEQYRNRALWAMSYLARVGAVDRSSRGHYRVTQIGQDLLATHPEGIKECDLRALAGDADAPHTWHALRARDAQQASSGISPRVLVTTEETKAAPDRGAIVASSVTASESKEVDEDAMSPTEQVEAGIERIHAGVAVELLDRLHGQEPAFFSRPCSTCS